MKIVFVGGQSVPGIGGVEAYMLNMAKTLIVLGHDVTIICSDRKAFSVDIDGIEIVHLVCPKSNMYALPMLFFKSMSYIYKNRKSIDIVNFQSIFFAFLPGWFATLCGCKVCFTIHSLAEDNPKHGKLTKTMMRIITFISIWFCGKNILTVSNSKAKEIKLRYAKTCSVVPCGVNLPNKAVTSNILEQYNIKQGHYYLTIGRIDPIKNIDILIQAFIKRHNSDFQLVIAGDYTNDYGKYLQHMAQGNKNVLFVGSVMGDDKDFLLKNCFVNCLVSSSEGMPISLLEAMAYGKPCIVSDIPAIHEVVHTNWVRWCKVRDVNSLVVQMNIAETDDNINMYGQEMAAYIINCHSWNHIAIKYINYLNSL